MLSSPVYTNNSIIAWNIFLFCLIMYDSVNFHNFNSHKKNLSEQFSGEIHNFGILTRVASVSRLYPQVCISATRPVGKRSIAKRGSFIACSRCCDASPTSDGRECNTKLCGIKYSKATGLSGITNSDSNHKLCSNKMYRWCFKHSPSRNQNPRTVADDQHQFEKSKHSASEKLCLTLRQTRETPFYSHSSYSFLLFIINFKSLCASCQFHDPFKIEALPGGGGVFDPCSLKKIDPSPQLPDLFFLSSLKVFFFCSLNPRLLPRSLKIFASAPQLPDNK